MTMHLRGEARARLLADAAARYEAGATIRQVADGIGYSYTATRSMLLAAGVRLRPGLFSDTFQPRRGGGRS